MSFIQNIQQRLLGNVLYKFSLIFCSIYVVLFFGNQLKTDILFYLFISILLSIGIAGLGYVMNDIKDFKDDLQNNKPNLFNKFSKSQSVLLVVLFALLSIFPWLYLPTDKYTFYLLVIEFLLFFVYAFPPFRLKEKGFLGIITDALYAQVVPSLLAVYTFSKISNTILNVKLIVLYSYFIALLGYLLYTTILFIKRNKTTEIDSFYFINTRIFNEFYEIHLPIILLVCFCFSNAIFIFILGFNLLIFSPIYLSYLKGFLNKYSI